MSNQSRTRQSKNESGGKTKNARLPLKALGIAPATALRVRPFVHDLRVIDMLPRLYAERRKRAARLRGFEDIDYAFPGQRSL